MKIICCSLLLLCLSAVASSAEEPLDVIGKTFKARDTLARLNEPSDDARACLENLRWPAGDFAVQCETAEGKSGDVIIRFPSPIDSGDAINDRVAMEWYFARDETLQPIKAPAVVVVHESGKDMAVGRTFAVCLRSMGLHTFLLQLPDYGYRRSGKQKDDAAGLITRMRQGVADVRRARDAVAALPLIDTRHIALQGTSLGGFVAADAGAIDDAYDSVFLMLAGGDLFNMIQHGERDAAKVREKLKAAGLTGDKLQAILWDVEPTRIAHRLRPERTWLYSATQDTVVPIKHAEALAAAAKLEDSHHIRFTANHYSGVLYLPMVLAHIRKQIPAE